MLICAAVAYAGINLRWTLSVAICGALMSAFILGKYYDRNKKSTFWKKPLKKRLRFGSLFLTCFRLFADHGAELCPREQMNVQMRHFLSAVFTDIA